MVESLATELQTAEFGDARLTRRLIALAARLSEKPHMSIPATMKSRAEMEAAYRFFDNPQVSVAAIMEPHRVATLERIRCSEVAILVHDTTQLDLTRPQEQVEGAGPLEFESRRGIFYHPLVAFDGQGLPLGIPWSKTWARESIDTSSTRAKKTEMRKALSIEEKESVRWLEGVRAARSVAEACPETECICVADSEADIYELFAEPRRTSTSGELHLLVRAAHDRKLADHPYGYLFEAAHAAPIRMRGSINVSARRQTIRASKRVRTASRDARVAETEVRSRTVTIVPPKRLQSDYSSITVNLVLVKEAAPPSGEIPIQWLLITTLPIETNEQVQAVITAYALRWQIEVYFKTLKSGCRIESRYFERLPRLLNCLAIYSIVAWKIMQLCRLSRECPDLSCEVIFEPCEWKSVYMAVRRQPPPKTPPTLNEMVKMIASLGGYVIRKSTNPGTQTLWFGMQRLHDLSMGWTTFGPDVPRQKIFSTNTCVER